MWNLENGCINYVFLSQPRIILLLPAHDLDFILYQYMYNDIFNIMAGIILVFRMMLPIIAGI